MKPVDDALVNAAYTLFSLHTKLYADVRSEFLPGDDGRTAAQISDSSDGLVQLGTHRSLWETLGNPYALMQAGGRMPRAWMGSNLVKGDEFRDLASRVGVMILPRGAADRTAVRRVYDDTLEGMVRGQTIQIYPQLDGGGRSKTGRPRPWSPVTVGAAINAAVYLGYPVTLTAELTPAVMTVLLPTYATVAAGGVYVQTRTWSSSSSVVGGVVERDSRSRGKTMTGSARKMNATPVSWTSTISSISRSRRAGVAARRASP